MSYYTALNLHKEPFSTSPDPNFFYHSSEHLTALHRLEIAIRLKRGLSLILGDVGTGKTTLSRALLQSFSHEEDEFIFHLILDPDFKSEYQFLSTLTKMFGISPFFRSVIDHREAIEKYLFQKGVEEKKIVVLIIDEGQKLSQPLLEILRTFLNYETNEQKLLQLVIMSQMELLPRIKKINNFMDRVSLKYIINPLDEKETQAMIEFRLKKAGLPIGQAGLAVAAVSSENRLEGQALDNGKVLFTPEAIRRIYEFTQGYPRKIAFVCHNALERLVMQDEKIVTQEMIDSFIAEEILWK